MPRKRRESARDDFVFAASRSGRGALSESFLPKAEDWL